MYKHLSHYYIQASYDAPYTILFSTIVENSYLVNNVQNRDRMRYVDQALDELRNDANVISHYDKQIAKGPKGKIEDVKYVLSPSLSFISEIKKANRRQMEITDQARQLGLLSPTKIAEYQAEELRQVAAVKYPTITRGKL